MPHQMPSLGKPEYWGTRPISPDMGSRYLAASQTVLRLIKTRKVERIRELDDLSEAKGMVNRMVRQDCHDWKSVSALLGHPDAAFCRQAVAWLMRVLLLARDNAPYDYLFDKEIVPAMAQNYGRAAEELEVAGFRPTTYPYRKAEQRLQLTHLRDD